MAVITVVPSVLKPHAKLLTLSTWECKHVAQANPVLRALRLCCQRGRTAHVVSAHAHLCVQALVLLMVCVAGGGCAFKLVTVYLQQVTGKW
jgi:hypothetical protein